MLEELTLMRAVQSCMQVYIDGDAVHTFGFLCSKFVLEFYKLLPLFRTPLMFASSWLNVLVSVKL